MLDIKRTEFAGAGHRFLERGFLCIKVWGVHFADFFSFFLNIPWKWNNLVIAQSVGSLTADSGVESLITAESHTFMEIDPAIISTVILLLPLIQEGLSERKYVHEVLVNPLSQGCPGKIVFRWTDHLDMTIAVISNQTQKILVHVSVVFPCSSYGKCSKFLNTFLFLF